VPEKPLRVLGIGDGRSRHFIRWARRLVDRGHDVHVLSNRMTDRPHDLDGITAHTLDDLDPLLKVRGVRRYRIAPALRRLAGRVEPDVVHSHDLTPYGWWVARAGLQPLVVTPWGRDALVEARDDPEVRKRAREAIAPGRLYVVNSAALERATVELGADPAKIRRSYWHANIDDFSPERADRAGLRERFGWAPDTPLLLSIKNFRPYSNIDVVLRAFARVREEEPRARLLSTAAGGWTRDQTEALVDELGLRPYLEVHEFAGDEIPMVLASVDAVVMLAEVESSPASLLESMASGAPLVCGIAPSIDEWVRQDEGAEVVGCRDVDAVAAGMLRLIREPEVGQRYAERNLREVHARFGDPGAEMERVYEELLAGV
jgi:glycosyltransferase involved in cell wall biosynthesis